MKQIYLFTLTFLCLTNAMGQSEQAIIQGYLQQNASKWSVQSADFNGIEITSTASSKADGVKHYYIRQTLNGFPVVNGVGSITLKSTTVISANGRFQDLPEQFSVEPTITAESAIQLATNLTGIEFERTALLEGNKQTQIYLFNKGNMSQADIPVQLMIQMNNNLPELVWDLSIHPVKGDHWWSIRISALTGELIFINDWVSQCNFDACENTTHQHQTAQLPITKLLPPPPPPGVDQYMVYALPIESPSHGDRSLVINPSDAIFSPYGWHDVDGIMGDEFTITRGNNVFASDDIDNDDIPGYSPDGGPSLNFNYAYDSLLGVQGNLDAVITNLFYMNNMMHDVWAYYGFDEESGNFQELNYSGSGLGADPVLADAQDGSGTNNANFGTPPEGESPRMQMYLWTSSNVPDLLTINSPASIAGSYFSSTAGFGPPIPSIPLTEDLVLVIDDGANPTDACETISNGAQIAGKIALVRRGGCTFAAKVEACQAQGAVGVIIMNNQGGAPIAMGGSSSIVTIPSIMVSQTDGNSFESTLNAGDVVNATIVNPGDLTATDSDFDNVIIAHEFGHGISTRLVGGADNVDCLFNAEQMGEGWSDWFGMMMTMKPTDQAVDPRGVGTYVTNEPTNGTGIRPAPYSTDASINNYKYANTNNASLSEPHGIGFVWASMLWDLNWALIDEYGFDDNLKTGTGGNNIAMALVIEGLKLTPCGPGFVDGRDAILLADEILYAGANKCLIWDVFANRGLGFSANQGDPDNRSDQVQAFDVDPSCSSTQGLETANLSNVIVYPNPTKDLLHVDLSKTNGISTAAILDISGKVLVEMTTISSSEITFDMSKFANGLYLLKLTDATGASNVQVIKH
jgi:hypothetical protein